jgi:hypothetical protein
MIKKFNTVSVCHIKPEMMIIFFLVGFKIVIFKDQQNRKTYFLMTQFNA